MSDAIGNDEIERRMAAKLLGRDVPEGTSVEVRNRRFRRPGEPPAEKAHIEVLRKPCAANPADDRFDVVTITADNKRFLVKSGVYREQLTAVLKPYEADRMTIIGKVKS